MRKILFRGKCANGENERKWAYGMPVTTSGGDCYIIEDVIDYDVIGYDVKMSKVDPNTVGQDVEMTARDGNAEIEIFEGDICEFEIGEPYYDTVIYCTGVVRYDGAGFKIYWIHRPANGDNCGDLDFALWNSRKSKVVGNIYDNPELLEKCR